MVGKGSSSSEEMTESEIVKRRDEVIRRMANTPPKPKTKASLGVEKAKKL